jgi:hypothetical protein
MISQHHPKCPTPTKRKSLLSSTHITNEPFHYPLFSFGHNLSLHLLRASTVSRRDNPRNSPLSQAVRDASAAELVDVLAVEVEAAGARAGAGHY